MADLVSDSTAFSCPFCTGQLKIVVPSCAGTGAGKKIATNGNYIFPPPGGQCLVIPNAPAPCAPPSVSVITEGQTAYSFDGQTALGASCQLQCAKGGLLSVASSGQSAVEKG